MTLPNGAAGLTSGIQFGVTSGDGSLPGLVNRTQDNVSATLKSQVQGSPGWSSASSTMFQGLNPDGVSGPFLLLLKALGAVLSIPAHLLQDVEGALAAIGNALQTVGADIESALAAVLQILGLGALLGGGSSSGGSSDPTTLSQIDALQQFLGKLGTDESVSTSVLQKIASTASPNVLHNPNFNTSGGIQGQGLWCWDGWVGTGAFGGINSSIRTLRRGVVTIYNIVGTSQGQFMFGGEPVNTGGDGQILAYLRDPDYHFLVDWALRGTDPNYVEWVNVPYPAAQYPMGPSVQAGATWLMNQIRQTAGPFIMIGDSQGCQVAAAVYDELRFGTMQDHRADLLGVLAFGNLRREQGHTFPGYKDPAPGTSGMCDVALMTTGPYAGEGNFYNPTIGNLVETEPLWWDFCVAGDYYACCPIEGNTVVPPADEVGGNVGCIGGIPGVQLREFYTFINQAYGGNNTIITDVINWGFQYGLGGDLDILEEFLGPVMSQIGNLGGIASPHNSYFFAKPWEDKGDDRTFIDIGTDYINSLVQQAVMEGRINPPVDGEVRELAGEWFAAQPEQDIVAGAKIMWVNVVCENEAFLLVLNCYDKDRNLIAQVTSADGAVISGPEPTSNWTFIQMKSAFVTAPGTAWACPVVHVTPAAMRTGIVWADDFEFEPTNIIDAAYLDVTNIPQLSGLKVAGPQGQADILTAFQNFIDKQASAGTQTQMTGVQWAQAFDLLETQAQKTNTAYQLGVYNHQIVSAVQKNPYWQGQQPSGQVSFALPDGVSLPTATIAPGSSLMCFMNTTDPIKVGFVELIAKANATPSGIFLNLYTMDPATANMTPIYSSADLGPGISTSSLSYVPVGITSNQPDLPIAQGVWWELVNNGSVSITVVASSTSTKPTKPYAIPPNGGASRTIASTGGVLPTSLVPSQVNYGPTALWICMSVSDLPPTYYPPNQIPYTSPGFYDLTGKLPSWLQAGDFVDGVAVAAGGGAGQYDGNFWTGAMLGQAGGAGGWDTATWVMGTDIPMDAQLKLIVGAGGIQGGDGCDVILGYGILPPAHSADGTSVSGLGTTLTQTVTAAAGDYLVVALTTTFGTFDVFCDGVRMKPLGIVYNGNVGAAGGLGLFAMPNVAAGARKIVANFATTCWATMQAETYSGISCAAAVQSVFGLGKDLSQEVTCQPNQIIVQAFATANAQMGQFSGGTNRLSGSNPVVNGQSYPQGLSLSDATATTTFKASNNVADNWGGIAVILNAGLSTVLLHAKGGPGGGPGGAANYNPANPVTGSLGASPNPNPKQWAGRVYPAGEASAATHLRGNSPGGGAAGGDTTAGPLAGGDAAAWLTARRGASSGGTVGGGSGIGGGGSELSVLFEAAGSGLANVAATGGTWTHQTDGGPTCLAILFGAIDFSNGVVNVNINFGSTPFTQTFEQVTYYNVNGTALWLFAVGLWSPPSGLQTITLSTAGSTATINDIAANTFTYRNVGDIGNWYHNSAHNATPALPNMTTESGEMAVGAFADIGQLISSFSQTQRWQQPNTASIPMLCGDSANPGTVSLSAAAAAIDYWGGVGGVLKPSS